MSLNQAFLDKLNQPSPQDDDVMEAAALIADAETITDDESGQAESEPSTQTAQADTELNQLRAALAAKEAEIASLKTAPSSQSVTATADDAEIDEKYQLLSDTLGEDVANILYGEITQNKKKLSELEQFKQQRESEESSAGFIRAVGNDALKTFNDPKFQAFAKGEKLGRKTLFDELSDIVANNDIDGAEFLIQQAAAFSGANKSMRKAQVSAGRNPLNGEKSKEVYDDNKAEALKQAAYKKRYGSPERKEADAKYRKYLETTI
jgi:hypothetical protein